MTYPILNYISIEKIEEVGSAKLVRAFVYVCTVCFLEYVYVYA
jgi:hypothetical protein